MKIAVAGAGYVGLSNALILARRNEVILVDPDVEKVQIINKGVSPIDDSGIGEYLQRESVYLKTTTDEIEAYSEAELVLVAVPTNYKVKIGGVDTSIVESVIHDILHINKEAIIVIKSTVPIGFTKKISLKYNTSKILFSPEFLREGQALRDCQHPSRIIIGTTNNNPEEAWKIVNILCDSIDEECPVKIMGSSEAEAVKLFSNTYLAMRVSFFNELDIYAEENELNSKDIITGVCLDPRIGNHYNNPSFGYGGYCLPKDTKQLLANYQEIPQNIISAVVTSNITRKEYIVSKILQQKPHTVGVYRLIMKCQSDNFRDASIMDVMDNLKKQGISVVIYEPILTSKYYMNYEVVGSLEELNRKCDVIIANRITSEIKQYGTKVYTRDIFENN